MSATPLTFVGVLSFPPDPGGSTLPVSINFASQYTQLIAAAESFTGSGSKEFDLSALNGGAGATAILVKVDPQVTGTPPVFIKPNSESAGMEIAPGGFLAFGSPNPSSGITALTVAYTGIATVRIWALG